MKAFHNLKTLALAMSMVNLERFMATLAFPVFAATRLTKGVTFATGNAASPETFATVAEVVSISGPDGSSAEIDITSLDDVAKEFRVGMRDEGQVTLGMNFDPSDTLGQTAMRTDRVNGTLRNFKITIPDGSPNAVITFAAYVMGYSLDFATDDVVKLNITLRISGAVTFA